MLRKISDWISSRFLQEATELEKAKFKVGIEILLHDTSMIFTILTVGWLCNLFVETVLVFWGFGALRIYAGGFHCKKSWQCLVCTGAIVIGGAFIADSIHVSVTESVLIYTVLIFFMFCRAPRRTKNNPLDEEYYIPFKIKTVMLICGYMMLGLFFEKINSYLLVASIFESLTLLVDC